MSAELAHAAVFLAGVLTFGSGYLFGRQKSHQAGHYRGVRDAVEIFTAGRDD